VFNHSLIKHEGHAAPANYNYGYSAAKMESLGEHLSLTEINSTEAERESVKIKLLEFFERELAKEKKSQFAAVITDVRPNGFFIELTESMTFGFIPMSTLTDDVYTINNAGDALIGRRTHNTFQLAAHLQVTVEKVDRFKRLIDFRPAGAAALPVPGGEALPPPKNTGHKSKSKPLTPRAKIAARGKRSSRKK
jgi:ribonuclease R